MIDEPLQSILLLLIGAISGIGAQRVLIDLKHKNDINDEKKKAVLEAAKKIYRLYNSDLQKIAIIKASGSKNCCVSDEERCRVKQQNDNALSDAFEAQGVIAILGYKKISEQMDTYIKFITENSYKDISQLCPEMKKLVDNIENQLASELKKLQKENLFRCCLWNFICPKKKEETK